MGTKFGTAIVLSAAVVVATAAVSMMSAVDADQAIQRPHIPPPGPELERARETVTFDIALPHRLPDGVELLNVLYTAPGFGQPDEVDHSTVDLWYAIPDGRRLHIWMSDRQDLEDEGRAPHQDDRSRPMQLNNGTWYEMVLRDRQPAAIVLGRTIGDITIEMDVQGDPGVLHEIAGSFDTR